MLLQRSHTREPGACRNYFENQFNLLLMMIFILLANLASSLLLSSQDSEQLVRSELTRLAETNVSIDNAATLAAQWDKAARRVEALPPSKRPRWRRTLAAVICRPIEATADDRQEKQTPRDRNEKLRQVTEFYTELLRKLPAGPASPHVHFARAETSVQWALGRRRLGEEWSELSGELAAAQRAYLQAEAAWRDSRQLTMQARALSGLAQLFFHFSQSEEAAEKAAEKAADYRQRAIAIYERLPQNFLSIHELPLKKTVAAPITRWASKGYETQANMYLLQGLRYYNRGLKHPQSADESIYLYAESLRIAMARRYVTGVNNVNALFSAGSRGEETGQARTARFHLQVFEALPDENANPHWRTRGKLEKSQQALSWIHSTARLNLAKFYRKTRQLLLARFHLDRAALAAADLEDRGILPAVYLEHARLASQIGRFDDALQYARRALDAGGSFSLRATTLLEMGRICEQQGKFEQAHDYYRWAWDLFFKPQSTNTIHRDHISYLARIRRAVSRMDLARNRGEAAFKAMRESASLTALEDPHEACRIHLDRIEAARWAGGQGMYVPSQQLLAAAAAAPGYSARQSDSLRSRLRLRGLRLETAASKKPGPASKKPGPASKKRVKDRWSFFNQQQVNLLESRLAFSPPQQPDEIIRQSQQEIEKLLPRVPAPKRSGIFAARLAIHQGELSQAASILDDELARYWRSESDRLDPSLGIESPEYERQLHHLAAAVAIRQDRAPRAIAILDMARQGAMLGLRETGGRFWRRLSDAEKRRAGELDDARTDAAKKLAELSSSVIDDPQVRRRLRAAQRRHRETEAAWREYKRKLTTRYKTSRSRRNPLDVDQIAELIGEQDAALVFSVGEYETCVGAVFRRQGKLAFLGQELPIRRVELEALVESLRMGCAAPDGAYRALAREIYDILIKPCAAALSNATRLLLIPDGALHRLPWLVLEDGAGTPLIERFSVVLPPSLAVLQSLRRQPKSAHREGCLLAAVQTFDNRFWTPSAYAGELDPQILAELAPRLRLPLLENTAREVHQLAALFGHQATLLVGRDAQEGTLLQKAGGARFVHFATHGLLDAHNPFQSALVLASPNDRQTAPGANQDGFLEAAEVLESGRFSGVELVSLSACETGLGVDQGSQGALGLNWAFLSAGARSVLASLWPVDDTASALLMTQYYESLRTGSDKAAALKAAVRHLRKDSRFSHPVFWAAFQVYGDWKMQ